MIAPMSSSTMPPDALPNGSVMPSPADTLPPVLSEGLEVSVTIPDLPGSDVIAHASIPGWDNLAMVDAFARAAERAREVLRTSTHPIERRLVGSRLLRLVPPALLPAGQRDRAVALSLPDAVLLRPSVVAVLDGCLPATAASAAAGSRTRARVRCPTATSVPSAVMMAPVWKY